jgi:hypothetical protein
MDKNENYKMPLSTKNKKASTQKTKKMKNIKNFLYIKSSWMNLVEIAIKNFI